MATSKLQMIKLGNLVADFARNPRLASNYASDDKDFKKLVETIDQEGFRSDKPLVVAKYKDNDTWKYRVIQGHRRFAAVTTINKRDNSKCTELPCIVYEGLSETDEWKLMIDHFHVKGLSEFEQYLAIKRLLLAGLTEEAVANQTGKSRGFVQRRRWIASAPQVVEDAYRAKAEGTGTLALTDPDLQEIKKAMTADQAAGLDNVNGGPNFSEVWSNITNNGRAKAPEPKSKTRKELLDMLGMVKDPIGKGFLKYAAGEPGQQLTTLVEELQTLRAKAASWDEMASQQPEEKQA